MGYAFISYSSTNQDIADAVHRLLQENGIETWMAPGDIPGGSTYADVITKAVKDCSCFILLLSDNAQNSTWVSKEVNRAVSYYKPVLPLQLEDLVLNDAFALYIGSNHIIRIGNVDASLPEIQQFLSAVRTHTANGPDSPSNRRRPGASGSAGVPAAAASKQSAGKKIGLIAAVLAVLIAVGCILFAVLHKQETPSASTEPRQTAQAVDEGAEERTTSVKHPTHEYVLNTSTHRVHRASCEDIDLIKAENYSETDDLDWAIEKGYKPCGKCSPGTEP